MTSVSMPLLGESTMQLAFQGGFWCIILQRHGCLPALGQTQEDRPDGITILEPFILKVFSALGGMLVRCACQVACQACGHDVKLSFRTYMLLAPGRYAQGMPAAECSQELRAGIYSCVCSNQKSPTEQKPGNLAAYAHACP